MTPQFLEDNGQRIAYRHHGGAEIGVLFLPGFRSDMLGAKATEVAQWCAGRGIACTRFDYRAHGESEGDFRDFTIGNALEDTLAVIDKVAKGKLILIGSSMGGWIALLAALERKERIAGIIGIAAAPDFTERLVWNTLKEDQRRRMEEEGELSAPSDYGIGELIYTHKLILEGRSRLLLDDPIAIDAPVRLLQGMQDADVPWPTAMDIQEKLLSDDVQVTLIKDGDHRLSRLDDLALLVDTLARLHAQACGLRCREA